MAMPQSSLFNQPRLRLALLYSGVIGAILLLLGYLAHRATDRVFDRVVDREISLLATTVNGKLTPILAQPGEFVPQAARWLPSLCRRSGCEPQQRDPFFEQLRAQDYHLQLLNLQGAPIAAIGELPDDRMANPQLNPSYSIDSLAGQAYHVHLMPLQNLQGEAWGYLQVGRSIQQFDDYMLNLHRLIFFGVPLAMGLIGGASWWLAGIAMRPLFQSYEQMQQFTANAAHELRTPIAAMKTMLEVAPTESATDQIKTLAAIQRQNDRLGKLAQDLLLLSRLDAGAIARPSERINLNDLVQDLEEELAPLAIAAQVQLSSEIPIVPLVIQGRADQIYRLVSNLIINAIHYTPEQGTIVLRLTKKQNQAMIAIVDSGIGIAAADLPHLFERFYRVHDDRGRQSGGSGLGLAIAGAIAKAHGGRIQVQSQVGEGSCFMVWLPLL
jgi:signal transduction histidine kinase